MAPPSLSLRLCNSMLSLSANVRNTLICRSNLGVLGSLHSSRHSSSASQSDNATPSSADDTRDPLPLYLQPKVQSLLSRITGFDLVKVAGPQIKPLEKPSYLLLTDEELAEREAEARERLKYRLQMPPYMKARTPGRHTLMEDPALEGHEDSKYVFADISFGVADRKRNVVVREPDGSLHKASWDVKERVNEIYSPREGRHAITPVMFEDQNLEGMISEGKHKYILDRACCQFEPDDPEYIRSTHRVYNAVNAARAFDVLRSTRHFGPFAFYLVWHRMLDHLLVDMLNKDLESDAEDLVRLFSLVHCESECAQGLANLAGDCQSSDVIKVYLSTDCHEKGQVELSLQAMNLAQQTKPTPSIEHQGAS